ncbi:hypothetical protein PPYR_02918 [Photinus pyralis]|uniref:Nuclease HARBI1 n=1 Tax=Photinus pyralis TaxID=7054 RepID=A0A5N4A1H3_PHOPY|nr:hypothetical protein PPYR_02918 [Photinus pyralis]
MWGYRVIVQKILQSSTLKELHSSHFGVNKCKSLARSYIRDSLALPEPETEHSSSSNLTDINQTPCVAESSVTEEHKHKSILIYEMDPNLAIFAITVLNGMAAAKLKAKRKKSRNCWVKQWVDKRDERGIMQMVNNELRVEDPEKFKNYIRMSKESFFKLLQRVEPHIAKINTNMRQSISARDKLMTTLRFLATGESYRNLMYSTRIHESTISLFIPEVCKCIYSVLKDEYLRLPRTQQPLGQQSGNHFSVRATSIRGEFLNYFNGPGAVEWQEAML